MVDFLNRRQHAYRTIFLTPPPPAAQNSALDGVARVELRAGGKHEILLGTLFEHDTRIVRQERSKPTSTSSYPPARLACVPCRTVERSSWVLAARRSPSTRGERGGNEDGEM